MNEQNEIEQLKRERDEILAKVEELDRLTHDPEGGINWPQVHAIFEELKALKPKPERLRLWANVSNDGCLHPFARISIHETKDGAERNAGSKKARIAVPMIEARQLPELPEMEEWSGPCVYGDFMATRFDGTSGFFDGIAGRHNATVRAFKKWAEDAKKEVGDE